MSFVLGCWFCYGWYVDWNRNVDVTMLQMLNTQERSREDWESVVTLADKRLKVLGIHRPEGSWDSIIEIGLVVMNGHN